MLLLSLGSTAPAHDRPNVDDLLASRDVVAVVDIRTHIERGAVDFEPFAELEIAAGLGPSQPAILGPLVEDLKPGHSFDLIGRTVQRFVAVVDRDLVGMPFAIHRGENGERTLKVVVDA